MTGRYKYRSYRQLIDAVAAGRTTRNSNLWKLNSRLFELVKSRFRPGPRKSAMDFSVLLDLNSGQLEEA